VLAERRPQGLGHGLLVSAQRFQPALDAIFEVDRIASIGKARSQLDRELAHDLNRWLASIRLPQNTDPVVDDDEPHVGTDCRMYSRSWDVAPFSTRYRGGA
jgi:hypothetical protein